MGIPLMAITPETAMMLAKHHNEGHGHTSTYWKRIAIILYAAREYTDGRMSETQLHDEFHTALFGHEVDIDTKALKIGG